MNPSARDAREDPLLAAAIEVVEKTHAAWRKALAHFNRCKHPGSIAVARREVERTEKAYRAAADRRDRLVADARRRE